MQKYKINRETRIYLENDVRSVCDSKSWGWVRSYPWRHPSYVWLSSGQGGQVLYITTTTTTCLCWEITSGSSWCCESISLLLVMVVDGHGGCLSLVGRHGGYLLIKGILVVDYCCWVLVVIVCWLVFVVVVDGSSFWLLIVGELSRCFLFVFGGSPCDWLFLVGRPGVVCCCCVLLVVVCSWWIVILTNTQWLFCACSVSFW